MQYACELSRAETRMKADKSDQLKEEAEKELWSRKVIEPTTEVIEALQTGDITECPEEAVVRYVVLNQKLSGLYVEAKMQFS